jgi:hypothetical protein
MSPHSAVLFCIEAQAALLALDAWPLALLQDAACEPLWARAG